ncbi:Proliferating cell nuclear antigen [Astathelohania contejeani]|uniref:DNA sliding clamp PCNA n=1 Tax=Astathelohania contejeani TaxID=164912 RepID=A0ABQ7I2G1_9MICR|nr:Proliferating cell nuclear antigen [Thelohania contejeani]
MFELKIEENLVKPESEQLKEKGLPQGRILMIKKIMESISDMVEDCELKVSEKGISIQIMDSMHVALADIFLSKNLFDSYRCDRSLVLGLKTNEFVKVLRNIKTVGTFMLYCGDDATNLGVVNEAEGYTLSFDLKLFNFEIDIYSFPELEYCAEVEMKTSEFLLLPKIVGTFAEFIVFDATKDKISFYQKGEMTDANLTLTASNPDGIKINVLEPITKELAMKYINYIGKVGTLSDTIKICMGNEAPVFFDLALQDFGYIRYYIAPKMKEDD